ncbi:LuxR C-terminal-related transcriptional regulator [Desulfosediminicola flagellatus]|uniref:helix-turn-helix transcriptional regulator n=1 Tax=Desulfosediminicola flagellatus TaxID=2569541 RepID=UPI0010ACE9F5|nr:LuxR C-terminal-related transcriptional regulator [Desulfosediminicola flagellatus]
MKTPDMYKVILNSLDTHVAVLDGEGYILETNAAWQNFARDNGMQGAIDCVGMNYLHICDQSKGTDITVTTIGTAIRGVIDGTVSEYSTQYPCHSPTEKRWYSLKVLPYRSAGQQRVIITHENITDMILIQEELRAKEELLSHKAEKLEETNIAMKVLLDHRNRDRQELENRFLANIRELVLPYLEKLKTARLQQREKALLSIMEEHLNDISSPFLNRLSSLHLMLTPQELEVALLVRQGKSSQEISDVLNIAVATVSFHRKKLRNKLGLESRTQNLRTYLLSLQ